MAWDPIRQFMLEQLAVLAQRVESGGGSCVQVFNPGDVPCLKAGRDSKTEVCADPEKPGIYDLWRGARPVKFNVSIKAAAQVIIDESRAGS